MTDTTTTAKGIRPATILIIGAIVTLLGIVGTFTARRVAENAVSIFDVNGMVDYTWALVFGCLIIVGVLTLVGGLIFRYVRGSRK